MGDKWRLLLGERRILSGKNEIPSRLLTVFQEEDKYMDADWAHGIDQLNISPADQEVPPELQAPAQEMLREAEAGEKPLGSEWDPMRRLAETLLSLAEPAAE